MRPDLPPIHDIWVYLAGSPLFALLLTLGAYAFEGIGAQGEQQRKQRAARQVHPDVVDGGQIRAHARRPPAGGPPP